MVRWSIYTIAQWWFKLERIGWQSGHALSYEVFAQTECRRKQEAPEKKHEKTTYTSAIWRKKTCKLTKESKEHMQNSGKHSLQEYSTVPLLSRRWLGQNRSTTFHGSWFFFWRTLTSSRWPKRISSRLDFSSLTWQKVWGWLRYKHAKHGQNVPNKFN